MFYSIEHKSVTIFIKTQPMASKNEWCGCYGTSAIKVRVSAPAVEGSANKELILFIAKSFKVPKSSVTIESGKSSKLKKVTFPLSEKFQAFVKEMKNGECV
ncbi:MAG: DUF167 domain-containing protein [Epsilonproteobacteria bacterium]|nr:DUF167 domain-containing protein [Campylobacterota bacterium]MBD3839206.1 DUF167 domain-containing protein [Campylobacterota bacterium]